MLQRRKEQRRIVIMGLRSGFSVESVRGELIVIATFTTPDACFAYSRT
jgi:hypothetical protein